MNNILNGYFNQHKGGGDDMELQLNQLLKRVKNGELTSLTIISTDKDNRVNTALVGDYHQRVTALTGAATRLIFDLNR